MSKQTTIRTYNHVQAQLAATEQLLASAPSQAWAFTHAKAYQGLLRELFTVQKVLYSLVPRNVFFPLRDRLPLLSKDVVQTTLRKGRV
jgi:hypothetical protein